MLRFPLRNPVPERAFLFSMDRIGAKHKALRAGRSGGVALAARVRYNPKKREAVSARGTPGEEDRI